MSESLKAMLSQLREMQAQLDIEIAAVEMHSKPWKALCDAWDGLGEAIIQLEKI